MALKMKTTSQMKMTLKTKTTSKNDIFDDTSTDTGQLILNWKCSRVSKLEMELRMLNVIYIWHCPWAHKRKRRHFHAKTTSAKHYIYVGVGSRDLFIDEAHMALDIFRYAVFFYSNILFPLKLFDQLYLFTFSASNSRCSSSLIHLPANPCLHPALSIRSLPPKKIAVLVLIAEISTSQSRINSIRRTAC